MAIFKTGLGILFGYIFLVGTHAVAQQWNPGDTLNIKDSDSTRINDFRNNVMNYTGQELIDDSFPNSWPIFGSKARMAVGGYVKLDYIQDFDGGYDRYQYEISNVPVPGDGRPEQDGYMNMHGRESRLNLDVRSITEKGMPMQIYFEFDFYNLDRGEFFQSPRLRHFYGVLGRLLIGRTWGTQTDLFAMPNAIDFAAGDAVLATRRTQIRFEDDLGKKFKYALALEMLEFPGIDGPDSLGQPSQLLPLLAGRITRNTASGGRLMLGASLFQLRWDGYGDLPNSTTMGWGFSFTGREYFGNKHYFNWMASYGDGWGSQVVSTLGSEASAILTPEGSLETMTSWNLGAGVAIRFSDVLTSNLFGNIFAIDPSEYRDENKIKSGESVHVNLIWSPIKNVNAGVEFMVLRRTNGDDNSGVGKRLQLMIKYIL